MLLFLFFSGCASMRTVEKNVFQSSIPEWRVAVSPEFNYFKNIRYIENHQILNKSNNQRLRNDIDAYSFIQSSPKESSMIIRGIVLEIGETQGQYVHTDRHLYSNKYLEWGDTRLSGETYEFITQLAPPRMSNKITASLIESGYLMPKCILQIRFANIVSKNRVKHIYYWEDASDSGFSCNKKKLKNEEQTLLILEEFNKRASESFKIIQVSN
jgi:hypothetical protein